MIDKGHSVPPFSARGGGGGFEPPTKFSKMGKALKGPQLWEGVTFSRKGVAIFTKRKRKLKSKIFNDN